MLKPIKPKKYIAGDLGLKFARKILERKAAEGLYDFSQSELVFALGAASERDDILSVLELLGAVLDALKNGIGTHIGRHISLYVQSTLNFAGNILERGGFSKEYRSTVDVFNEICEKTGSGDFYEIFSVGELDVLHKKLQEVHKKVEKLKSERTHTDLREYSKLGKSGVLSAKAFGAASFSVLRMTTRNAELLKLVKSNRAFLELALKNTEKQRREIELRQSFTALISNLNERQTDFLRRFIRENGLFPAFEENNSALSLNVLAERSSSHDLEEFFRVFEREIRKETQLGNMYHSVTDAVFSSPEEMREFFVSADVARLESLAERIEAALGAQSAVFNDALKKYIEIMRDSSELMERAFALLERYFNSSDFSSEKLLESLKSSETFSEENNFSEQSVLRDFYSSESEVVLSYAEHVVNRVREDSFNEKISESIRESAEKLERVLYYEQAESSVKSSEIKEIVRSASEKNEFARLFAEFTGVDTSSQTNSEIKSIVERLKSESNHKALNELLERVLSSSDFSSEKLLESLKSSETFSEENDFSEQSVLRDFYSSESEVVLSYAEHVVNSVREDSFNEKISESIRELAEKLERVLYYEQAESSVKSSEIKEIVRSASEKNEFARLFAEFTGVDAGSQTNAEIKSIVERLNNQNRLDFMRELLEIAARDNADARGLAAEFKRFCAENGSCDFWSVLERSGAAAKLNVLCDDGKTEYERFSHRLASVNSEDPPRALELLMSYSEERGLDFRKMLSEITTESSEIGEYDKLTSELEQTAQNVLTMLELHSSFDGALPNSLALLSESFERLRNFATEGSRAESISELLRRLDNTELKQHVDNTVLSELVNLSREYNSGAIDFAQFESSYESVFEKLILSYREDVVSYEKLKSDFELLKKDYKEVSPSERLDAIEKFSIKLTTAQRQKSVDEKLLEAIRRHIERLKQVNEERLLKTADKRTNGLASAYNHALELFERVKSAYESENTENREALTELSRELVTTLSDKRFAEHINKRGLSEFQSVLSRTISNKEGYSFEQLTAIETAFDEVTRNVRLVYAENLPQSRENLNRSEISFLWRELETLKSKFSEHRSHNSAVISRAERFIEKLSGISSSVLQKDSSISATIEEKYLQRLLVYRDSLKTLSERKSNTIGLTERLTREIFKAVYDNATAQSLKDTVYGEKLHSTAELGVLGIKAQKDGKERVVTDTTLYKAVKDFYGENTEELSALIERKAAEYKLFDLRSSHQRLSRLVLTKGLLRFHSEMVTRQIQRAERELLIHTAKAENSPSDRIYERLSELNERSDYSAAELFYTEEYFENSRGGSVTVNFAVPVAASGNSEEVASQLSGLKSKLDDISGELSEMKKTEREMSSRFVTKSEQAVLERRIKSSIEQDIILAGKRHGIY